MNNILLLAIIGVGAVFMTVEVVFMYSTHGQEDNGSPIPEQVTPEQDKPYKDCLQDTSKTYVQCQELNPRKIAANESKPIDPETYKQLKPLIPTPEQPEPEPQRKPMTELDCYVHSGKWFYLNGVLQCIY